MRRDASAPAQKYEAVLQGFALRPSNAAGVDLLVYAPPDLLSPFVRCGAGQSSYGAPRKVSERVVHTKAARGFAPPADTIGFWLETKAHKQPVTVKIRAFVRPGARALQTQQGAHCRQRRVSPRAWCK